MIKMAQNDGKTIPVRKIVEISDGSKHVDNM